MTANIPIDPVWFVRPDGRDASRTIHGVAHATRVHIHALELAETLDMAPWERSALHYAAMWHDIGRTHDGVDYYHGAKSAGKVVGLGLHTDLDPVILEAVLFAVTHHCGDETHAESAALRSHDPEATLRIFRVLKDADALDRVRLGRGDLEPSFLRFEESWARIDRAWELLREIS